MFDTVRDRGVWGRLERSDGDARIARLLRRDGGALRVTRRMRRIWAGLAPAAALALLLGAPGRAQADSAPDACNIAHVVAGALPAIVNITVVRVVPAAAGEGSADAGSGLADAAMAVPDAAKAQAGTAKGTAAAAPSATQPAGREKIEIFVGSGFVVDPSGLIVTNKHVIQDAAVIRVTFHDRQQVPAKLVAAAALVDEAVLKVDMPHPLPFLRFGNSDALRLGEPVFAVGNPIGLGTSVSSGVISGLNRDLMRTPFDDFIQTDASINPGNSGGPLMDCAGHVIGMDTALLSNSKVLGSIGLGFAMPSNDVRFVYDKLRDPLHVQADWIGLRLQDLTGPLAAVFGRPDTQGAIVTGVTANSPAARAGLKRGDVVTAVDGQPQPDARAILRAVIMKPVGQKLELTVWDRDQRHDVSLRGQEWPGMLALRSDVLASAQNVARAEAQGLGLQLGAATPAARKKFGLADHAGVLVEDITPGSEAETMGLQQGDLIEQVNDKPAVSAQAVMDSLQQGDPGRGDFVALLVRDRTATRWVTLYVGRIDVAALVASPHMPGARGAVGNASVPSR